MASNKQWAVGAVLLLASSYWMRLADAQSPCQAPTCNRAAVHQNGLAAGCTPRRITYGYYPTHWRRWPTDNLVDVPTPAVEQTPAPVPTDAVPPRGDDGAGPAITPEQTTIPRDQLRLTPDEQIQAPAIPESGTPAQPPTDEPETMLPFADEPPAPPSDSPGSPLGAPSSGPAPPELPTPSTDQPAPDPRSLEPRIQPPPQDDAPPVMPDDDPFKDDPVQPRVEPQPPAPGAADRQTGRTMPEASRRAPPGALRWRPAAVSRGRKPAAAVPRVTRSAAPELDVPQPKSLASDQPGVDASGTAKSAIEPAAAAIVSAEQEPGLLRSVVEHANVQPRQTLPVAAPARGNPLRAATVTADASEVVATAAWTRDRPAATVPARSRRHNPLRDN